LIFNIFYDNILLLADEKDGNIYILDRELVVGGN